MKTEKQLQKEIEMLKQANAGSEPGDKGYSKFKRRLSFLNSCLMYIESEPSLEFVEKEKHRLEERVKKLDAGFDVWATFNGDGMDEKQMYTAYKKECGIGKYRQQIKNINFILG